MGGMEDEAVNLSTRARVMKAAELFTVFSTVRKFLPAKPCNSAQAAAKAE